MRGREAGAVGESHPIQGGAGGAAALGRGHAAVEQPGGDVVDRGQAFQQDELLEDHAEPVRAHPGELPVAEPFDRLSGDAHRAAGRPVQPGGQVEQGGLAGPGRAEDGDQVTAVHGERDPAQRLDRWCAGVDLADVAEFQNGGHVAGTSTVCPSLIPLTISTWPLPSSNQPGSTCAYEPPESLTR